jgi:uncharacterized caspase-like protein
LALAALIAGLLTAHSALAEKRVALVIGNDKYPNLSASQQLQKAVNDAEAVGDTLERLGFQVIRGANLGRDGMFEKLAEFKARLNTGDVAVFFYAGHGVAIGGVNYLVPSDVPRMSEGAETRVRGAAISEPDLIAEIRERNPRVTLLTIDACRDNPFPRSSAGRSIGNTRGLADARPPSGVFSIYSAGIGQTALDRLEPNDPHRNSVFTRMFVEQLAKPGLDLAGLAIEVRERVADLALKAKNDFGRPEPHEQTPAYYDQTRGGRIYLAGRPAQAAPTPAAVLTPPPLTPAADESAWMFLQSTTDIIALRRFVAQFPNSARRPEAEARVALLEREASDAKRRAEEESEQRRRAEAEREQQRRAEVEREQRRRADAESEQRRQAEQQRIAALPPAAQPAPAPRPAAIPTPAAESAPEVKSISVTSEDGRIKVVAREDGKGLEVFDAATSRLLGRIADVADKVERLHVTPGGRRTVVVGGEHRPVAVFDNDGSRRKDIAVPFGHFRSVLPIDERRAVISSAQNFSSEAEAKAAAKRVDKALVRFKSASVWQLWDLESGAVIANLNGSNLARDWALSRDGRRFGVGGEDGVFAVSDVTTGKPVTTIRTGFIKAVALNHDGSVAALSAEPRGGPASFEVQIYELPSGRLFKRLRGKDIPACAERLVNDLNLSVESLEFSADGKVLTADHCRIDWRAGRTIN